jgi:glycosyltransferase involved in cell wall biosynthesis
MQSLNILHVLRAPIGGLFRHVADLVRGQTARGHSVGIVADSLTVDARARETLAALEPALKLGLSLTPIHRQFGPKDLPAAWHVMKRVQQTQPDVIHGHGAKGGAFARLALSAKPAIRAYTPHGGSLLLNHDRLSGKVYLGLERLLMPRGDVYLFESAYSANVFNAKVGTPSGLVRVVHNGVTSPEFEPVALKPNATDLLFLGEFRPVKGIDTLIEAIAQLHRAGFPVTATMVGGGPEAPALKAKVLSLGLDRAIRFMAPMAMREALALGRMAVIPSRAESLPYVVLEIAAAARPLITTDVGGIPEIYGALSDTLIRAGDAEVLAAAIKRAMQSPETTAAIAQQLRAQVAASFSADAMVEGVLAAYEQAIAHGGVPARAELAHA